MIKTIRSLLLPLIIAKHIINQSTTTQNSQYLQNNCPIVTIIGPPVRMVNSVNEFINTSLDFHTQDSRVKYLYSNTYEDEETGYMYTKLIFEIETPITIKYIGVWIRNIKNIMGGTKLLKFIVHSTMNMVIKILEVPNDGAKNATGFSCGDLKYMFTSYQKILPQTRARDQHGRPINTLAVLNLLNATTNDENRKRNCVTAHYVQTVDFYGIRNTVPHLRRFNCLSNKPGIAFFKISCNQINGRIRSLQVFYNNYADDMVTETSIIGDPTVPANNITTIMLQGIDKIQFRSFLEPGVGKSVRFQTYDENNQPLQDYSCGSFDTGTRQEFIVFVKDFLGFNSIQPNAVNTFVEAFEIMTFKDY